ncbi:MAG TPA: peptidoglycan-associated lipoprotein Pal [Thermoanaerobaculia bacterium]|nr:peptidoglycan-associated lipoprotein Pal [Thermoanaerobaculia bacterium]
MKRKSSTLFSLAALAVGLLWLASACAKKPPTTAEEKRPAATPPPAAATPVPPPVSSAPIADESQKVLSASLQDLNQRGYLQDAFFDYDKSELRDDARSALATDSEWLKKYPTIQILIEGHCDERGTSAYNLALGDRRANAARDYLVSLGLDGGRVKTVSYGKERPVCTESTEACWQKNRRAHLVITAK